MKTVATVKKCVQTGPDDWSMVHISKVFDQQSTLWDVVSWADHTAKGLQIQDVIFSRYDGEHPEDTP